MLLQIKTNRLTEMNDILSIQIRELRADLETTEDQQEQLQQKLQVLEAIEIKRLNKEKKVENHSELICFPIER